MLYIIYPSDPTTKFMGTIIDKLINGGDIEVIRCVASNESYTHTIGEIKKIPDGSKVVFIGHSTSEKLYGGMSDSYERRSLVELKEMSVFKSKELFLVSCFSSDLLRSSRPHRENARCIGFGLLPSELEEVTAHKQLNKIGLNQGDIDLFKLILSETIAKAIDNLVVDDISLNQVFNFTKILFNKKISDLILSGGNRKVAEVLFYVVNEAVLD